jgi:ribose 1,5-bisphosphokinase PhnN
VLAGASGSGKTTSLSYLARNGFQLATKYTTRSLRRGDVAIAQLADRSLQGACDVVYANHGITYGLNTREIERKLGVGNVAVVVGDVRAIEELRRRFPTLTAVWVDRDATSELLSGVLQSRGLGESEITSRLLGAELLRRHFESHSNSFDFVVRNDGEVQALIDQLEAFLFTTSEDAKKEELFAAAGGMPSSRVVVATQKLSDRLASANIADLFSLTPRQFEEVIGDLLTQDGFKIELTPVSRDGGVDIIAIKHDLIVPQLCLVQCKRYNLAHPVGIEPVQRLYGVSAQRRANVALLATTSRFTRPALDFKESVGYQLSLQDYVAILAWLKRHTH